MLMYFIFKKYVMSVCLKAPLICCLDKIQPHQLHTNDGPGHQVVKYGPDAEIGKFSYMIIAL